uniref:FCP1 homology domain-containing protein n=1 Tax=Rhabditophanes sp. KR3021 TaxID=114890 RepID=A0AC35TSE4_9BILA
MANEETLLLEDQSLILTEETILIGEESLMLDEETIILNNETIILEVKKPTNTNFENKFEPMEIDDPRIYYQKNNQLQIVPDVENHLNVLDIEALKLLYSPPPVNTELKYRIPVLPLKRRSTPKYSLVLDLDETLVHCSLLEIEDATIAFPIKCEQLECKVYVRVRPFFHYFIDRMSKLFELIIFTAGKNFYARKLCDILDPKRKFIKHRLFREHCVGVDNFYIKDLSILGRDLAHVVIVDNSILSFAYQVDNGIPIKSWYQCRDDEELLNLIPFLENLVMRNEDVRPLIREKFHVNDFINRHQTIPF